MHWSPTISRPTRAQTIVRRKWTNTNRRCYDSERSGIHVPTFSTHCKRAPSIDPAVLHWHGKRLDCDLNEKEKMWKIVKNWSRKTGIRWLTHRFYPLQTASSTDINTSHHVKQHCHNHGRCQEPWIYNQIYDDDGQVLQETLQWIRGKLVDRLESRKQPTNRKLEMCVGYLHRWHRTGHLVAMNQHCRYRERTDWEFVRSGCYWRRSFWFV